MKREQRFASEPAAQLTGASNVFAQTADNEHFALAKKTGTIGIVELAVGATSVPTEEVRSA